MGKASRSKTDGDRRSRIAAQREAERRAEQRKRIYLAGGSILVVVIVVVAIVLVKLNTGSSGNTGSDGPTGTALASLTQDVTTIPASTTDKVAGGTVPKALFESGKTAAELSTDASANNGSYLATVDGTPLTSRGKPEVLYIGAEFCPFCAAQRWSMVNALSRFGSFTGLTTSHSSSDDSDPNTPTFTFYKSTYTSTYLTFTSVEQTTNVRDSSGSYPTLQNTTAAQNALITKYDPGVPGQGGGSIPFIDYGNKYAQVGNLAPLSPTLLAGKTWAQVGAEMKAGTSALGQAELANANYFTAAVCTLTNNQPATACTPTIQKLEADFAK